MIRTSKNQSGTTYRVIERARIADKSTKVHVGTFDTLKAARAAEQDHRARQRMIADGKLPENDDPKRTLGQSITEWLAYLDKPSSKGHRSRAEYASRVENHVPASLMIASLSTVSDAKLVRMRDQLEATALTANTINGVMGALSSAFTYFRKRKWITSNPFDAIDALVIAKPKHLWIEKTSDITALIGACNDNIRSLVAVLLGTGMRLDEALHLPWSCVSFERRTIDVMHGRKGPTKSGKARTIGITDSVLPVLKQLKLAAGKNVLVWPGTKLDANGKPRARDKSGVFRPFKAAVLRAGLPAKLRIHDLRHTFASHWMANGGNIFDLAKWLGHSSVVVTEQTYAHLAKDAHLANLGRVSFAMPTSSTGKVLAFATPAT